MLKNFNKAYGLLIASLITLTFLFITLSKSTGLIQQGYYDIFYYLGLAITLLSWLIVLFLENSKSAEKVFYFEEQRPVLESFNNLPSKVGIAAILSVLFIAGLTQGITFIDIPQPFIQSSFSVVGDSMQGFYKFMFQSWIPGLFEEFGVFLISCLSAFILMYVFGFRKNYVQVIISYVISSGIAASILTLAHRMAYGSDETAYLGIFIFEWVVQFFNLFTGMFISWIPHIVHNYAVIFVIATGFSIGGVALTIKHFKVNKNESKD